MSFSIGVVRLFFEALFTICHRKVIRDNATGGRDSERMKLKLEIRVEVNKVYINLS